MLGKRKPLAQSLLFIVSESPLDLTDDHFEVLFGGGISKITVKPKEEMAAEDNIQMKKYNREVLRKIEDALVRNHDSLVDIEVVQMFIGGVNIVLYRFSVNDLSYLPSKYEHHSCSRRLDKET